MNTTEEKVLFCLEEIERYNVLFETMKEFCLIDQSLLNYAELEVQSRRADRQAKTTENLLERQRLLNLSKTLHTRAAAALKIVKQYAHKMHLT